jgi:hypothetical protein
MLVARRWHPSRWQATFWVGVDTFDQPGEVQQLGRLHPTWFIQARPSTAVRRAIKIEGQAAKATGVRETGWINRESGLGRVLSRPGRCPSGILNDRAGRGERAKAATYTGLGTML